MTVRRVDHSHRNRDPFFVRQPNSRHPPSRQRASGGRLRLTARGGILLITTSSFVAALLTQATGQSLINGSAFGLACVLTAALVRPGYLLPLAVSPPLAYFAGALAAESLVTLGSERFVRGVALGMGTNLADMAPTLFLGTAIVLITTAFRGLPREIRNFSDQFNGRTPPSR